MKIRLAIAAIILISLIFVVFIFLWDGFGFNRDKFLAEKGFFTSHEPPAIDLDLSLLEREEAKIYVINYWATWCTPCVKELPDLNKLKNQFGNGDVSVLAVGVGETLEKMEFFLKKYKIERDNIQMIPDEGISRFPGFDLSYIPLTFVVDNKGKILSGVIGIREWHKPEFRELIRSYLE